MDEAGNHHSQQTDTEQKTKHRMFSLIGGYWTMRTHGHRGGSTTHWGLLWGIGEGQRGVGSWGEIAWGEMPDIGEGEEGSKPPGYVYMQHTCNNPA